MKSEYKNMRYNSFDKKERERERKLSNSHRVSSHTAE
jgi:hypothetical protein